MCSRAAAARSTSARLSTRPSRRCPWPRPSSTRWRARSTRVRRWQARMLPGDHYTGWGVASCACVWGGRCTARARGKGQGGGSGRQRGRNARYLCRMTVPWPYHAQPNPQLMRTPSSACRAPTSTPPPPPLARPRLPSLPGAAGSGARGGTRPAHAAGGRGARQGAARARPGHHQGRHRDVAAHGGGPGSGVPGRGQGARVGGWVGGEGLWQGVFVVLAAAGLPFSNAPRPPLPHGLHTHPPPPPPHLSIHWPGGAG